MISWRYHIVSIVAVILAFGLGILAGSSVVNDRFIRDLERNYDEAIRERDDANDLVAVHERFAEGVQPVLRDDVLLGERAIVVTTEGMERPARRAVDELSAAGVEVLATLSLSTRLAQPGRSENHSTIEEALGISGTDAGFLRDRIADDLAVRLAVGPDPEGGDDVLGRLLDAGLVTADRDVEPDELLRLGGDAQLVVLAAGGVPPDGTPGPHALLVPFTERLVRLDAAAAVVGTTDDRYGFVTAIRERSDVPDCAVVTVDDIDLAIGGIALTMGLDRFLEDPVVDVRPGGDYGVDGDAMIVPGADEVPGSCRI